MKSPYTIFISFHFPQEQAGIIELKSVSFFTDNKLIKYVQVNHEEEFDNITEFRKGGIPQVREEEESSASFFINNVAIPHTKQNILVTALVTTVQGVFVKTWEVELTPYEEEELRNDLLDSIMSV